MERYKNPSAVMIMLVRDNGGVEEVLLQKRKGGGKWGSGLYGLSAVGHVEENESMKAALCRESKEEINIEIFPDDLEFICLIHANFGTISYYNGCFKSTIWNGIPEINEPEKCSDLIWVNINNLPSNILPDRKLCIENYKNNIKYSEFGWGNG